MTSFGRNDGIVYLDCIQHFYDAGVAHGSYFLQCISGEREAAPVGGDIEGEDAAV